MEKKEGPSEMDRELGGTLVGSILACMEAGNFINIDNKAGDGNVPLGEMTTFEKACFTVAEEANEKRKLLAALPPSKELFYEAGLLKRRSKQARELMQGSMEERLDLDVEELQGLILVDNFQIFGVKNQGSEDDADACDCPFCQMRRASMSSGDGIIGVHMVEIVVGSKPQPQPKQNRSLFARLFDW